MMTEAARDPNAIERDIDRTRGRIDKNVDELNARLSPDGLVNEATAYLRDGGRAVAHGVSSAGESVGRVVRDNPIPAALIGAGVAWLAVSAVRNSRSSSPSHGRHVAGFDDYGQDAAGRHPMSTARGAASPSSSGDNGSSTTIKDTLAGAADNVEDRIRTGAQAALSRGREVKDAVADQAQGLRDRAVAYGTEAGDTARDVFDRQPLLVGVLGLAVGAAIGLALPHTRREDSAMGPYRDHLGERVKDYGREQADRAERAAEAAVSAAREELDGDRSPMSSDGPEGSASQVVDKAAKAAKSAAKAAKDEVKASAKETRAG